MKDGHVHYTPSTGRPALREAIAGDVRTRLGLAVEPARGVLVTVGSSTAIMTSLMTVLEPGDEFIVPEPMYLFYVDWGEFFGARTVPLPLQETEGFQISREALDGCVTDRTRAIVINSPHNPTGAVLNLESLEAVAQVARERDLLVLSDEAYDRLVYRPFRHVSIATLPGMQERTLLINSFSKSFAMDGWRLGYVVGPPDLIWEIDKAQQHTVISATTFVQFGAVAALQGGDVLVRPMLEEYEGRRRLMLDLVASVPQMQCFEPQGAFYIWLRTGIESLDGWELADILLEKAHVAITPGEVFGPSGRGFIRISYSTNRENLKTGMVRLIEVTSKFR
jgi:aspartate/methionine/tyrosine aminotransferase